MSDIKQVQVPQGRQGCRSDKFGIAAYYDVGVRTIENWLARGIISGQKKGKKLEFDIEECDRRVSARKS
jgi:hypothetical protein